MRKAQDVVTLRRPDEAQPPRWGLYSLVGRCWLHGDFKTRRQAAQAARLIEVVA